MRARLMILIALGAGLALFYAFRPPPTKIVSTAPKDTTDDNALMLHIYDLECPTTSIEPEIELDVSVDPSDNQTRLSFRLSETHDFYVQSFMLEFWYKPDPDTTCEESPYCFVVPLDHYIKAGEVFEGCVGLNGAEVGIVGGDMGTSENWGGHVLDYAMTKWCTEDPELLRREETEECIASSG